LRSSPHPAIVQRLETMQTTLFVMLLGASGAAAFQAPSAVLPSARRAATCSVAGTVMQEQTIDAMSLSRRGFFKSSGVAAITIGTLGFEVPQSYAAGLPPVNSPAPEFMLPSNRGKEIGLKDLKGKWSVLYFYPGDFTSGCTIEAQNFEKNAASIRKLGAEIYGVSVDSVEKHLDFEKSYGLSFPLLSDKGGAVSGTYGTALKIPFVGTFSNRQTYLIDPEGNLRWVFTDVQSRINTHAEEVITKLKELTKA